MESDFLGEGDGCCATTPIVKRLKQKRARLSGSENILCILCLPFCGSNSSTEKDRTRSRPVNLDVAIRAIRVLRVQVVLRTGGLIGADTVRDAVAGQTELSDATRI